MYIHIGSGSGSHAKFAALAGPPLGSQSGGSGRDK